MWYMNEEREQLQKMIRDFSETEIRPFVKEMEEKDAFPTEIVRKAGELGLIALMFPEQIGGMGPKWVETGIMLEEMAKVSNCVADTFASIHAGCALILQTGNAELIQKVVVPAMMGQVITASAQSEPTGGTRLDDFTCTASIEGNEIVINGGKIFCTNAGHADYYTINCKTKEPYAAPFGNHTLVLVEKDSPGFKVGHIENKVGWHGSATGQLYFTDCRVPMSNIIATMDMDESMLAAGAFSVSILMAAVMLGSAEGVYEKALAYAKERKHGDLSIFDKYQSMRHRFTELRMEIELLRSLVFDVLADLDKGNYNVSVPALTAKVKGAEIFEHVASECVTLCGGNGLIVENDIERYYRDAKVCSIAGMSVHHLTDIVANQL